MYSLFFDCEKLSILAFENFMHPRLKVTDTRLPCADCIREAVGAYTRSQILLSMDLPAHHAPLALLNIVGTARRAYCPVLPVNGHSVALLKGEGFAATVADINDLVYHLAIQYWANLTGSPNRFLPVTMTVLNL